jgi:hypothetical protein
MWNRATSSKCFQREIAREHALHRYKLSQSRSRVDNTEPRSAPHLQTRAKSLMLKRERYTRIEHDNALLLRRMMEIEAKPSAVSPVYSSYRDSPSVGSLNRAVRVQELTKILDQNKAILRRLERTKPNYSTKGLIKESVTQNYLAAQVSSNSGRVPVVLTFNEQAYGTFNLLRNCSTGRPTSAVPKASYSLDSRPRTAGRVQHYMPLRTTATH